MSDNETRVILKGDSQSLLNAFNAGAARAKKFESEMQSVTTTMKGHWGSLVAAMGVGISAAGIINFGKSAFDVMDNLDKLSNKIGVSTETLQVLQYQAKLSGVSNDELGSALARMSRNAVEAASGTGKAKDAFSALGISTKELKTLSPDQLFLRVAQRLDDMPEGMAKTAYSMQMLGKSGYQLGDMLKNLANGGFDRVKSSIQSMGMIMDRETIAKAAQVHDQFEKLEMAFQGVAVRVIADLLPSLDNGTKALMQMAQEGDLVRKASGDISDALKAIGSGLDTVASIYKALPDTVIGMAGTGLLGRILFGGSTAGKIAAMVYLVNDSLDKLNLGSFGKIKKDFSGYTTALQNILDVLSGKRDWDTGAVKPAYLTESYQPPPEENFPESSKSSFSTPLASDQQKAIADWEKKMIDVRAEIEKGQYDMEDYESKIIDIQRKYAGMMAEAAATMKERNITLDTSPVAELKRISEIKVARDFEKKVNEETNKDALKSAEDRSKILLDNETFVTSRTKTEWENRIIEEDRLGKQQNANLTKLLILGLISREDYCQKVEALEAASGRKRLDIVNDNDRQILEAQVSHQLSLLDAAEKNMTMSRGDVAAGRIAALNTQLQQYNIELQKAGERGDDLARMGWQTKIDDINAKITDQNNLFREQSGIFSGGLVWGIKEYGYTMNTQFKTGEELAKSTGEAMRQGFEDFFFDPMEFSFDNFTKAMRQSFSKATSEMMMDLIKVQLQAGMSSSSILSSLASFLGFSGSLAGYSTGFGDWTGGLAFAKGGINYSPALSRLVNTVVDRPMVFPMAKGYGLIGEAGRAEGVFPLTRDSSGDLAVKAVGTGTGNAQEVHNHYHISINAVDAKSFSDLCKKSPDAIIDVVDRSASKNGRVRKIIKGS